MGLFGAVLWARRPCSTGFAPDDVSLPVVALSVCPPCVARSMGHAWKIRFCDAVWAYFVVVFAWFVLCVCLGLRAYDRALSRGYSYILLLSDF